MPVPPSILDHTTVRNYLLINLLVLPGLGSWMAGRRIVGIAQATLALTGFAFTGVWFVVFVQDWARTGEFPFEERSYLFIGLAGAALFIISWLWAFATGLQILSRARTNAP